MRLYRLFLYLYPASFRSEYGNQLTLIFAERRSRESHALPIVRLWIGEFFDILINASQVHWDILVRDLRYTTRMLSRSPGFTVTAILVAGLGIGANTAVFSVTDHVLLRPLPFPNPGQLVRIGGDEASPPNYSDFRKMSTSFESMAAYTGRPVNLLGQGDPLRLEGAAVTSELFPTLKVQAAVGRIFNDEDLRPGASSTVMLSDGLWKSQFNGDTGIVGKTIRLGEGPATVIGVMPSDFFFPSRTAQVWTPLILEGRQDSLERDNTYIYVVGRMKPGVDIGRAQSEMEVVGQRIVREHPKETEGSGRPDVFVASLRDQVPRQARLILYALFGASLCVLLIACANLGSLLLARSMSRRKELAVRMAIGAGRERLVRQLLTESVLISFLGGFAGICLAAAMVPVLSALVPSTLPISDAAALDPRVLAFAAALTLVTGLAFGVLPAVRIRGGAEALREGSRSGVGGRKEHLRSALIVAEITASVVLLTSTGLLVRALWQVESVDPGFQSGSVLTVQTALPAPKYDSTTRRVEFYRTVLSGVKTIPTVESAAFVSFLPMTPGVGGIWGIDAPGAPAMSSERGESNGAALRFVTSGYFETLGIPLKRGRDIAETDGIDAPWVAVVSESLAKRFWPGQDPIGRRFQFSLNFPYARKDRIVVGVVGDIRFRGIERTNEPQLYLSYQQIPDGTSTFYSPKELVIQSSGVLNALIAPVRGVIKQADPELPIASIRTLRDMVDLQTTSRSTQLWVIASFAALSLLLAGLGIHGLLSFAVSQRQSEFSVRVALGAQSSDILKIVLGNGLFLASAGAATGLCLSYVAGRSMQALLAGIPPFDPVTFVVAGVIVFLTTLSGSLLPARRALRVDPTLVIRGEW
jgi:putative ABC transport system permease protein